MKKIFFFFLILFPLFSFTSCNPEIETREVKLFYYQENLDKEISCSPDFVQSVSRDLSLSQQNIIGETLNLLLLWPTEEEKLNGFSSEFPQEWFYLKSISFDKQTGILTLDFPVIPWFSSGGSCRVGLLDASIKKTALQFDEVKEVKYTNEEIFQP